MDSQTATPDALPHDMPEPLRDLVLRDAKLTERMADEEAQFTWAMQRLNAESYEIAAERDLAVCDPEYQAWFRRQLEPYLSAPDENGERYLSDDCPAWLDLFIVDGWGACCG